MAKKKKKKQSITFEKSPKIVKMPKVRKISGRVWVFLGIAAFLLCVFLLITGKYTVKTITVEGNVHYTNDEIVDMVMKNQLDHNSLYLFLKYRKKGIEGIPFIEKMNVSILAPDTIKITVYEKAVAGYIEYLGKYMYFDKDGIIVETSDKKTVGIPQITGLKCD